MGLEAATRTLVLARAYGTLQPRRLKKACFRDDGDVYNPHALELEIEIHILST